MQNNKVIYFSLSLVSASVLCFEIITTRIASLIFVSNYAFIILSMAIVGIGCGSIYAYYKIVIKDDIMVSKVISRYLLLIAISMFIFIIAVIKLKVTSSLLYFVLMFFPYFFAGIIYSQIFKYLSGSSFKIYAADLTGAAIGSVLPIIIFEVFNAPNAILFLSIIVFIAAILFSNVNKSTKKIVMIMSGVVIILGALTIYGRTEIIGKITIGKYDEKDFYYVYPNAENISEFIESRWSIHGRSDLVAYKNQDMVRQLFVDGAAGTQMLRFNGNINNISQTLYQILMHNSSTIPLLYLKDYEKDDMLIIGPGGGKEVIGGLFVGAKNITGIEINPDFVDIVKEHKAFNGGIYTDFPNIDIQVQEGRHYIKDESKLYDLIVMVLPSTEQLQSIDNFAMSENYLLTNEAILDYLKILTPEGRLVFTVHNRWELVRLIVTTLTAFEKIGVSNKEAINHFLIIGQDYEPTIVIKKKEYSKSEIDYVKNISSQIPEGLPTVTYLPQNMNVIPKTVENNLIKNIAKNDAALSEFINAQKFDVSAVTDDSPYFYKVIKGIPDYLLQLLSGVLVFGMMIIVIPYSRIKNKNKKNVRSLLRVSLLIFVCLGTGFMLIEIALFQKLILYLGSPTISLSILLSSLLIGMGIGSYFSSKIFVDNIKKKLSLSCLLIIVIGLLSIFSYPKLLNYLLAYSQILRSIVCVILLLPLGFALGIPFPTTIRLLKNNNMEAYVPWMYGVNGVMSVAGSVLAIVISMLSGFSISFLVGLLFYVTVFLLSRKLKF